VRGLLPSLAVTLDQIAHGFGRRVLHASERDEGAQTARQICNSIRLEKCRARLAAACRGHSWPEEERLGCQRVSGTPVTWLTQRLQTKRESLRRLR
jgi:hypothetical protein